MKNRPCSSPAKRARILLLCAAVPLILVACGEPSKPGAAAPATPEPFTGQIHEVKMRGTAEGYFYEPKSLVIKSGDKVRFTMVDGAPHNVSFLNQDIPTKAKVIFEREGILVGALLQAPGQTTEVHFIKELPPGTYNYICDPHATLGMTAKIIVTL